MKNAQDMQQPQSVMQESVLKMPTPDGAQQNSIARAWELIEKVRIGMLTTQFCGGLRARPLEARVDRNTDLIWFVTDVRGGKDEEIGVAHNIGLAFSDEDAHVYLSITGRAFVIRDTAQAKAIWKQADDAWFPDGPSDPNVRLLRIEPATAELWDGPSSVVAIIFKGVKQRQF